MEPAPSNLPLTPSQLFRLFEGGGISREELHAAMAEHAESLIEDMEDAKRNPVAAYIDGMVARQAAARLMRRHGEKLIRETLAALAEVPDFPPALLLWNAMHRDVPLYCFVRTRREPVFRILKFEQIGAGVRIRVEYGRLRRKYAVREEFSLRRNRDGHLFWDTREVLK